MLKKNKDRQNLRSVTSFIPLATSARSSATLLNFLSLTLLSVTIMYFQSRLSKNLMECQLILIEDCFEKLFDIETSQ